MWRWLKRWLARGEARPARARAAPPRLDPGAGNALFEFQWRNGRWLERLLRDKYPLLRAMPESLAEIAVRGLRRELKAAAGRREREEGPGPEAK
ncbi:MAG: hypothetical protein AB1916_08380 [Thermodesulfobacteriota bacterium]